MSQSHNQSPQQADLTNCAREPIHIPGSIQPHGYFLALNEPDLVVRHASRNCAELLQKPSEDLVGRSFSSFLTSRSSQFLKHKLGNARLQEVNPITLHLNVNNKLTAIGAVAHRSQGLVLLELEPLLKGASASFSKVYQRINAAVEAIGEAADLPELYRVTAQRVKELSGYQRVMIYEFDRDWNGKVVAEAREADQDSFLGLHYPASDIPEQARRLYRANWLRSIPNVEYTPSPIYPTVLADSGQPLDLSTCSLRSVSPLHIQYLKNMQVGASTSVSVIKDGELWGLIALHHKSAAYIPYEMRQGLEFIGRIFSIQLAAKQKYENQDYKAQLRALQPIMLEKMQRESAFMDGLHRDSPSFLDFACGCTGGAVLHRGRLTLVGSTPPEEQVWRLVAWLTGQFRDKPLFHTTSLAQLYAEAAAFKDAASGLLAISIPEVEPSYIIWFKPEVIQTVNWGGDPNKPVDITDDGTQLSPRRSFVLWQETVRLRSLPWQPEEIDAIEELRRSIVEVDLERQVRAAMASNAELDQFASVISHDLKEPLRGIGYFADFLQQDLDEKLDPESRNYLVEIKQLTTRAQTLISELYEYSRVGRLDMAFAEVDMNEVVQEVHARLKSFFLEKGAELRVGTPLPRVLCDRVRISEVFANLITNAIKYNDRSERWVELGADTSCEPPVFYVRDNGIGIADNAKERIFKMFQRLHQPGEFGGGTGVGLPIVKRIIDRHGGRIWVESLPGKGSTFHFTLRPDALS